jgi:peptidoglycan/LPS O-acetylase OafA/YrhL
MSGKPRDRLRRFAIGASAYLIISAVWLYGVVDQGKFDYGSDLRTWSLIGGLVAVHVLFGWLIREWAALLLPIVLIVVVIPAGYPESQFEPPPLWFGQIFYSVFEITAIAVGLGLRAFHDGWRRMPSPSS